MRPQRREGGHRLCGRGLDVLFGHIDGSRSELLRSYTQLAKVVRRLLEESGLADAKKVTKGRVGWAARLRVGIITTANTREDWMSMHVA
jgi:hypothetical protein